MTDFEEIEINLCKLHLGQTKILSEAKRFNVLKCGRRFGKTELAKDLIINPMLDGYPVAYFAPVYKDVDSVWDEVKLTCRDIIESKDEQLKQLKLITGGLVDMWSLEEPDNGRGRKYKRVIIDEAEKAKKLKESWENAIRGTLVDFQGDAWFMSTPKFGPTYFKTDLFTNENKFKDWKSWRFTSYDNPFLPKGEIEQIKAQLVDISFRCEYLAEDVDLSYTRWCYAFDRNKHIGEPELNSNEIVYLSWDFNRRPMCCSVVQHYGGQVNVLETIKLPNSSTYEMCSHIKVKYPNCVFNITGDASGKSLSAMTKDAINHYIIIMNELGVSDEQLFIPGVNPKLEDNQVLVNSIFQNYPVKIHSTKAAHLIYDCENVRTLADGSIQKTNREDPTQQADAVDTWRYFCNVFMAKFLVIPKENISNIAEIGEDERFDFTAPLK